MKTEWMIYGVNGYSAQLATEKAVSMGLKPILAGRNKQAIESLASKFNLESRVFDLTDPTKISEQLTDVMVVSHCAGPFSATAKNMMLACIRSGSHYTDITGEVDVFDTAQSLDKQAKEAGVVLCSGVGFDVIPTDCMAAFLKQKMPDATELNMGFHGGMALSPGTAKTMVESLGEGIKVRRQSKIINVSRGCNSREIDYGRGKRFSTLIPWGDLSTAYWQTQIPNISIYTPHSGGKLSIIMFPIVSLLLKFNWVQKLAKSHIEKKVTGPSQQVRDAKDTYVWGEAINSSGNKVTARIRVPNGYTVTMDGILITAKYFLNYQGDGGCFTPAQLMGYELAEQLPGASKFDCENDD